MTIRNAIKKLSRFGEVKVDSHRKHYIHLNGYEVSFYPNGSMSPENDITCVHTCRIGEKSDSMTDYFPGSYWDNLTQAINFACHRVAIV